MQDRVPALVFGALLLVTGGSMLLAQRRAAHQVRESTGPDEDAGFLARRVRRRSQVAGMILLIGVMIPLGDSLIPWRNAPGTFAVYWLIVIGLAVWTGLLAVGDLVATRAQVTQELNRLHRRKLELRDVAQQLQNGDREKRTDH